MPVLNLIIFGVMAVFAGISIYYSTKMKGSQYKRIEPSYYDFFRGTGYRVVNMEALPPEQSAKVAAKAWMDYLEGREKTIQLDLIRLFQDLKISHYLELSVRGNSQSGSIGWFAQLEHEPKALMHICDKKLGSFGKSVGGLFSNVDTNFKKEYEQKITTGNTAFDSKYAVYAPDGEKAMEVLSTPGLMESLLACTSVDLRIKPNMIEFRDIEQKNIALFMNMPKIKWVLPYIYLYLPQTAPLHEMTSEVIHRMWVANR
jgi:Protein of unknown function (DUF3137)